MSKEPHEAYRISRRRFLQAAAGAGAIIVGGSAFWPDGYAFGAGTNDTGLPSTLGSASAPEQVHLTFGSDASSEVTVSWAVPAPGTNLPYLQYIEGTGTVPPATPQVAPSPAQYTDGVSGETVYLYHVPLTGLGGATTYTYMITDPNTGVSFTGTFTTAPSGRVPFAFTSFGDLGTPGNNQADSTSSKVLADDADGVYATYSWADPSQTAYSTDYSESAWNAYLAVTQLANMSSLIPSGSPAPLFHLMNGDLAYADKQTVNASNQYSSGSSGVYPAPEVWRDFGLNVQRSAANMPWMPGIGNHEAELDNGPGGTTRSARASTCPATGPISKAFTTSRSARSCSSSSTPTMCATKVLALTTSVGTRALSLTGPATPSTPTRPSTTGSTPGRSGLKTPTAPSRPGITPRRFGCKTSSPRPGLSSSPPRRRPPSPR